MTSASYTYDDLGRKLSETVNYGTFTKTFSYTYYTNGLKKSCTAPDSTTYEYAYGANNELREVRIPGLGSITISEYQWNRPKTMLYPGGSTREYEYDPLMRLTRLTALDPGGNSILDSSYEYDSLGNIVSKSTEHGDKEVAGVRTYFFYADEGLVAEYDVSGAGMKTYGYRPDLTWTTDPLWLKQAGAYYFYQNDHLGTPQKLVAQNGAVVWAANDNNMWWPIPYLAGDTDRLWTGGGLVSYLARISGEELLVEAGHQTFTGLIVDREDQVQKDGIWYYRQLDSQRQLNRADTFIRMFDGRQEISVHFLERATCRILFILPLTRSKSIFMMAS